jgi:hypothetical protein
MEVGDVNLILDYLGSQCATETVSIDISERGQRALNHFREMNSKSRSSQVDQVLLNRQSSVILDLVHQLQNHTALHNEVKAEQLSETLRAVQELRRDDRPDIRSLLTQLIERNESQLNGGWTPFLEILNKIDVELDNLQKFLLDEA